MKLFFAEMDPEPLIRTDTTGFIIQTNEASRKIFPDIEDKRKKLKISYHLSSKIRQIQLL